MGGSELKEFELIHKAVLWLEAGATDYGDKAVGPANEINVRWEGKTLNNPADPQRQKIAHDAVVFVDREIPIGSLLWKGAKDALPQNPVNMFRVVFYEEIEDLKGYSVERHVLVVKHPNQIKGA